MQPIRIKTDAGKVGWRWRVMNPATRCRTWRTFWFREPRDAEKAKNQWLESMERKRLGMADGTGWTMPFAEAVEKFITEAPMTPARRKFMRRYLATNPLGLTTLADLSIKGGLTAKCVSMASNPDYGDMFVRKCVQQLLKQFSRWCAASDLLPSDPLSAWPLIPRTSTASRRKAFLPDEFQAVLEAAAEYDRFYNRAFPTAIIFKTLLITGNRPSAVLSAKVGDLQKGRIMLPPGSRIKRNGACTIPPEFEGELRRYLLIRGKPGVEEPLLVSQTGIAADRLNLGDDFRRAMVLAAVRRFWPDDSFADPLAVAQLIYSGRHRGFDGMPPKDPAKLEARKQKVTATTDTAQKIGPEVTRWLVDRDMYCCKTTHITWARRLVNHDSVRLQVGHAGRDVEEGHYLDMALVDARESSQAVLDVLGCKRTLDGKRREPEVLALAAGAENLQPMDYRMAYGGEKGNNIRIGSASKTTEGTADKELIMVGAVGFEPTTSCTPRLSQQSPLTAANIPITSAENKLQKSSQPTISAEKRPFPPISGLQNGLRNELPSDLQELVARLLALPPEVTAGFLATAKAITGAPKP